MDYTTSETTAPVSTIEIEAPVRTGDNLTSRLKRINEVIDGLKPEGKCLVLKIYVE